jgi:hypothetical protein
MQMLSLPQSLLVTVFRAARSGRRPNLTVFCKRMSATPAQLQQAFDELERAGFLSFSAQGERLTLEGLAVGAALSRAAAARHRPLASCRPLAA